MATATLLFDADCGFCRWCTVRILGWDRRNRLRAVPLQSAEADRLLHLDEPRKMASWHLVVDGKVFSAGGAVAPLARLLPGGRPIAWAADAAPGLTERAYRWVAAHRSWLSRLVRGSRRRSRA